MTNIEKAAELYLAKSAHAQSTMAVIAELLEGSLTCTAIGKKLGMTQQNVSLVKIKYLTK